MQYLKSPIFTTKRIIVRSPDLLCITEFKTGEATCVRILFSVMSRGYDFKGHATDYFKLYSNLYGHITDLMTAPVWREQEIKHNPRSVIRNEIRIQDHPKTKHY